MKTKIKVFVKKIKNWLLSLAKWAKKYLIHIFGVFILGVLLLSMVFTTNCNKKTAKAQNLNSSSPVFVVPNLTLNFQTYGQCTTFPIFVGVKDSNPVCYRARATGVYEERRFYFDSVEGSTTYYKVSDYEFLGYRYVVNSNTLNREYLDLNYNNINGDVYFAYDNTIFNDIADCLNYSVNTATSLNVSIYTDSENRNYLVFNVFGTIYGSSRFLFSVKIQYLINVIDSYTGTATVPLFISSNASLEYVSQELLNQSYSNGYSQGYITGRNEGYNNGFNDGIEYSVDSDNFKPFKVMANGVTEFLDIKLFGDMSLSILIYIAFGFFALSMLLKLLR